MTEVYQHEKEDVAIPRKDMFAPMLTACRSFAPMWTAFLEEWDNSGEELPTYLALADLACHLIDRLAAGETSHFPQIFDVVEQWHVDGCPYVKEAATVGFLESLQNSSLHTTTTPEDFEPWLGPESRRWWGKLEDFWSTGKVVTDD